MQNYSNFRKYKAKVEQIRPKLELTESLQPRWTNYYFCLTLWLENVTTITWELERSLGERRMVISKLIEPLNDSNNTTNSKSCKKSLSSKCESSKYPPEHTNGQVQWNTTVKRLFNGEKKWTQSQKKSIVRDEGTESSLVL